MKRLTTNLIAPSLLCAVTALACGSDIQYTVTDLGTLGGPTSAANAISQNGIVVGNSELYVAGSGGLVRENHPCIFQANGQIQDLGLLDPVNGISGEATFRAPATGKLSVRRIRPVSTGPRMPSCTTPADRSSPWEPLAARRAMPTALMQGAQIAGYWLRKPLQGPGTASCGP